MHSAWPTVINIHEQYANTPISSECGRSAQADKIDIGVLLVEGEVDGKS